MIYPIVIFYIWSYPFVKNIYEVAFIITTVMVIIISTMGVAITIKDNGSDRKVDIICEVNTGGSGIYLNQGSNPDDYIQKSSDKPNKDVRYFECYGDYYVVFPDVWGGKIFGTPGSSSIQHIQLRNFVKNILGLKFDRYIEGLDLNKDTVYFDQTITSYDKFTTSVSKLTGAFIWEYQYSIAITNGCKPLITNNQMFPDDVCCIVAGSHAYISSHHDETTRFMAAYLESVEAVGSAIKNGYGEKYDDVVGVAIRYSTFPDDTIINKKIDIIQNALKLVKYSTYDTGTVDPLLGLKNNIIGLADDLYTNGSVDCTIKQLGFDKPMDFADEFVDSSYINDAIMYEYNNIENFRLNVAIIGGDIHQIAMRYGVCTGIFEKYGIEINLITVANGTAVSISLENGSTQFGFMGVASLVIRTINGEYLTL